MRDHRPALFPLFPYEMTYTAGFTRHPGGIPPSPKAALGVKLRTVWNVGALPMPASAASASPSGEQGNGNGNGDGRKGWTRVEERAEIWAPLGLLGYVRRTVVRAHEELMRALEKMLEALCT
ncbi:hypothetical protein DACRYDRAFT_93479 [Dacryopinax primogenitus]|uniref:DUF7053 domain-containing protein n=1 Tax=Dacryopinax primogenitus (strain DJM 731) TaxID=1858805 RepID=M5G5M8_DACPD|nr:uncharacterized protein DACRYDRAFT_93479 [Dacryopinax primogenitus]EJU04009.1 hypothetical protein DACRYDRAFT_93479 [Dacryopinax primogenitus]